MPATGIHTRVIVLVMVLALSACNPLYVSRAAYEEGKILWRRRPIDEMVQAPDIAPEKREKLAVVQAARTYAERRGFSTGKSFTTYSELDRAVLTWVVVGCKADSFSLHTWWFPFVGRVPYKGYFDHENALEEESRLKAAGYETSVRGAEAFSTLGWFNDPVLTPMLQHHDIEIVNTVLHELFHSTFWLRGDVNFNESAAQFIGLSEGERMISESPELQHHRVLAKTYRKQQFELALAIESLYERLKVLYESSASREEKLRRKAEVYRELIGPLKTKYPTLPLSSAPNNAEIMQLKLYMTGYVHLGALYDQSGNDFRTFVSALEKIKDKRQVAKEQNAFSLLAEMVDQ